MGLARRGAARPLDGENQPDEEKQHQLVEIVLLWFEHEHELLKAGELSPE
jgi:hypothetical protein